MASCYFEADVLLLPPEVLRFAVGVITTAAAMLCLHFKPDLKPGVGSFFQPEAWSLPSLALVLVLLPAPALVSELTPTVGCAVVALCAMACVAMQTRIETLAAGVLVVLVSCAICLKITEAFACASLSAAVLAVWASTRENDWKIAGVGWMFSMLLSIFSDNEKIFIVLSLLPVVALTASLLLTKLPLPYAWHLLPLGYLLQLWKMAHGVESAVAAAVMGLLLAFLPSLTRSLPSLSALATGQLDFLEQAGLGWMVLGLLHLVLAGHSTAAITGLMLVGMVELVLGLSFAEQARLRRLSGLACICLGIFVGAFATGGLVQGMLLLLGSLLCIGMAIIVLSSRSEETTNESLAEGIETRNVLLLPKTNAGLSGAEDSVPGGV